MTATQLATQELAQTLARFRLAERDARQAVAALGTVLAAVARTYS